MVGNDRVRAEISAIINYIDSFPNHRDYAQPEDREALEIVKRIEAVLKRQRLSTTGDQI